MDSKYIIGSENGEDVVGRELVNSSNDILNVCISDIKSYNLALMKLINIFDFKEVFQVLCSAFKNLVKNKIDKNANTKELLVRLV